MRSVSSVARRFSIAYLMRAEELLTTDGCVADRLYMFRLFSYREFIRRRKQIALMVLPLFLLTGLSACEPVNRSGNTSAPNSNARNASAAEPTIEASPVSKTDDQWQVISSA